MIFFLCVPQVLHTGRTVSDNRRALAVTGWRAHRRHTVRRQTPGRSPSGVRGFQLETRRVCRRFHEVRGDRSRRAQRQGDHARPVCDAPVLRLQLWTLFEPLAVHGAQGTQRQVAKNVPRQLVPERRPSEYAYTARIPPINGLIFFGF